jgi:hypothetical protein
MTMRKRIVLFSILLWLCPAVQAVAGTVSASRALTVAQNFLLHHVRTFHSWGGSTSPTIRGVEPIQYGGELVGYNFLVAPAGHLIVPVRDELPPVKFYSETSTLSMADSSDVTLWVMNELYRHVHFVEQHQIELAATNLESTPNGKLWTLFETDPKSYEMLAEQATNSTAGVDIEPLLTTAWAQGDPYWQQTPQWYDGQQTVTGCVATAAAQIMKYWHYPTTGQNSTSYQWYNGSYWETLSGSFSGSTYDWGNMLDSYAGVTATKTQQDAVALLMSDVGIAFHMTYGPPSTGSGASVPYGTTVYPTYFGYKSTIKWVQRKDYADENTWMKVFESEVLTKRPSQWQIGELNSNPYEGHSVVVDGYRDSPIEQIHINLGWGNLSYIAWYVSDNIVANIYDFNDTSFEAALIGIEPQTVPTALTAAASNIGTSAATLNGSMNPNGLPATMYFEWGTTIAYGNKTTAVSAGSGTTAASFSENISGLTPSTSYHYRIVGTNTVYPGYGDDVTFTTAADQTLTATTKPATSVSSSTATLNGSVIINGSSATAYFQWGLTTAYGTNTSAQTIRSGIGSFGVSQNIAALSPNTTYHYCLVAYNSDITVHGSDVSFTTASAPPAILTTAANGVTSNSATIGGSVNPNGSSTVVYFQWGTSTGYGYITPQQSAGSGTASMSISASLTGLSANTTYHYRAVASNNAGTSYGLDVSFATGNSSPPTVTTTAAGNVAFFSATLNGTVNPNGSSATAYFQWGTTTGYGSTTPSQSMGSGSTQLSVSDNLSGLLANTTYHYRLVASSSAGTSYGSDVSFTTSGSKPTVATAAANNITSSSVALNGSANPNGASTTAYFQWGLTTAYGNSTASQSIGAGTSAVNVSANLSGLSANTAYHYRMVAYNNAGTSYGLDASFTTIGLPPTVTAAAASNVGANTATLGCTVNPHSLSTTVYFQWGTSAGYGNTTPSQSIGSGTNPLAVTANISGLSATTTYHFRCGAYNSAGISYGPDVPFTTIASPPTAVTTAVSNVTTSSATMNGTVNPNGSSATAYFQWGTTTSYGYTAAAQSVASGSSPVPVAANVSGLSANTTYHYRLVVYNSAGTSYGSDVSFVANIAVPTVTTTAARNITSSSATLNGSVTPNGSAATVYFQWGATSAYGSKTASQSIASGTSPVPVTSNVSGLSANTTYHYRLVAYNSAGTSYGSDVSFATSTSLPTVTTTAATSVTASSATMNGTVNPNGSLATAYFQWGTTTGYGNSTGTVSVSTSVNINAILSGLSANKTYHYRTVAYNSAGTSYGSDVSFTTTTALPTVTTSAATLLTSSGATMNGTVNPNGSSATAYFQWGTTTGYGNSTGTLSLSSSITSVNINAILSGLSANKTYHYRAVAYDSAGTSYGSDVSFTTSTSLPTVTTTAATNITASGATMNGTVNPNGSSATVYFQWGTTTGYGNSTGTLSLSTYNSISATLSGLSVNTTYHYRIVAYNSAGTSYGSDVSFTTHASLPTVTTAAATDVTANSATMNATVNPNGAPTAGHLQ